MNIDFKKLVPHLISIVAIILISIVYFLPQFQGKKLVQTDTISFKASSAEARAYQEKTGNPALWTDSMFGGMPTYQISAPQKNNLVKYVEKVLSLGIQRPAGYFILGMLGFYFLLVLLGVSPWVGLIGALLFGLSTNNMVLYESGHMSKVRAIMSSPLIIAGVLLVFRKKYLLGGALFGIFLGLNIYVNHIQMTYYLAMAMAILLAIEVYRIIKSGDMTHLWKSLLVLAVGSSLALAASSSRILTTLEYTAETVRGNAVLDAGEDRNSSGGMEWERAMAWSNGAIDLLPSFIPMAAGGGGAVMLDKDSALAKLQNRRQKFLAPMYHGDLTFTGGPIYFGAVAFFLFFFGAFAIRGPIKWWLLGAVLLTFILSMGKNFPGINRFIFDYFPLFNKFRTPNSVLSVTALFIPLLGALGLYKLVSYQGEDKADRFKQPAFIALGLTAGVAVLLALLSGVFFDFAHDRDSYEPAIMEAIKSDRQSLFMSSAWRTAGLIVLAFAFMYAFIINKIPSWAALLAVGLLGVFDLWQIDRQYLSADKFKSSRVANQSLQPRPVDEQIMADTELHFRVHDVTIDPFNSAIPSAFHSMVGGYHPAKLQRYDDLIQGHIGRGNVSVLSMLNTRYFIVKGQDGQPAAQRNSASMGNAWFVNNINFVNSANEEFEKLNDFDPAVSAIIHNEYKDYIGAFTPQKQGTINLTSYNPNELIYQSNSNADQLAVFSEVWYGPNKGWQAYLDGVPVDHIRANYILRAMKIPAGNHEIRFEFKPASYYTGETISLIASLLLVIAAGVALFFFFKNDDRRLPDNEEILGA